MKPIETTATGAGETAAQYVPVNLNLWTRPDCYMGAEWPEWYVFLGRNRDSDCLTESNFEKGLEAWKTDDRFLDPQTESNTYLDQLNWASHQRSDGMAEFDLSMGPCLKGGTAVKSCTTFSKSNHAASAGSGPEVSADVLKFLK